MKCRKKVRGERVADPLGRYDPGVHVGAPKERGLDDPVEGHGAVLARGFGGQLAQAVGGTVKLPAETRCGADDGVAAQARVEVDFDQVVVPSTDQETW